MGYKDNLTKTRDQSTGGVEGGMDPRDLWKPEAHSSRFDDS